MANAVDLVWVDGVGGLDGAGPRNVAWMFVRADNNFPMIRQNVSRASPAVHYISRCRSQTKTTL